jgi:predicted PurR-regulated permease PerM
LTTFWDFVWGFILLFFWMMALWIFIQVFADIFRRRDMSGGWKVIWIVILFALPFLGALIYLLIRPVTEQDKEEMAKVQEAQRRIEGYSAADEIAKLTKLKEAGSITDEEFQALKQRALTQV